jgi:ribosome-binding protein aMBF1 (putative translation factor)
MTTYNQSAQHEAADLLLCAYGRAVDPVTAANTILDLAERIEQERDTTLVHIGRRIRQARQRPPYPSQREIAERIGLRRWEISRFERGYDGVYQHLDELAAVLGVTVAWLTGNEE